MQSLPAEALRAEAEPPYPAAAAAKDDEAARALEDAWHDDVLTWGRKLKARIDRICRWSEAVGAQVQCGPTSAP